MGTITKRTIGGQDALLWDGTVANKTFTATTSTGRTMTMRRLGYRPEYDWVMELADVKARGPLVDVRTYGASGSTQSTTGSISAGTYQLTLAAAKDFENGQGIRVVGAGVAGADLIAVIESGEGTTTLTLDTAASTTVSGANVYHDDTDAITTADATGKQLLFPAGTYAISSDTTISSPVIMLYGAIIDVDTHALTLNGPFQAGLYQVFDDSGGGSVTFGQGATPFARPEWWGAAGDGNYTTGTGTNSTSAVQAAVDAFSTSAGNGGVVLFAPGQYKCNIVLASRVTLQGSGTGSTYLFPASNDSVIKSSASASTVHVRIRDLYIDGTANKATFTASDGIHLETTTSLTWIDDVEIMNVRIFNMGQYGIYMGGSSASGPYVQQVRMSGVKSKNNTKAGLYVKGMVIECLYQNCMFTHNGDASNPNTVFALNSEAPYRHTFLACAFNGAAAPTTVTAFDLAQSRQIGFYGCDFEEANIMLKISGAVTNNVTVIGSQFASTNNVTSAIEVAAVDGLVIENNKFTCSGTMTSAIYSGAATANVKHLRIGYNVYSGTITTAVNIYYNTTISSGAINAYQDVLQVDTEGAAASDDLDYIYDASGTGVTAGLQHGQRQIIRALNGTHTVVVKNGTGNILTADGHDIVLDENYKVVVLYWDKTKSSWIEVRSPVQYPTTTTGGDSTGTNVFSASANALGANTGFLTMEDDAGNTVYVPYWTNITP